jgi:hypothetical protein
MGTVAEYFGIASLKNPLCIGVEVELEGADVSRMPESRHLSYVGDPSLRNDGIEIVFNGPKGPKNIEQALIDLRAALTSQVFNISERTSVHVHINARNLTEQQVATLLAVYTVTESALYSMCGKDRYDNIYCPGLTNAAHLLRTIRDFYKQKDFAVLRRWPKYTGINLSRIGDLGTVEFRMHEGTADIARIRLWIDVISRLRSGSLTFSSPEEVLAFAQSSPAERVIRHVYGNDLVGPMCVSGDYHDKFHNNVMNLVHSLPREQYKPERVEGMSAFDGATEEQIEALQLLAAMRAEASDTPPPPVRG